MSDRPVAGTGIGRGLVVGVLISFAVGGCLVNRNQRARLTGTCEGACAHYIACKPGHPEADRAQCNVECPQVFSDGESLRAYESLSCTDAVEYIDGTPNQTATRPG